MHSLNLYVRLHYRTLQFGELARRCSHTEHAEYFLCPVSFHLYCQQQKFQYRVLNTLLHIFSIVYTEVGTVHIGHFS